jgi:hypothetical protein
MQNPDSSSLALLGMTSLVGVALLLGMTSLVGVALLLGMTSLVGVALLLGMTSLVGSPLDQLPITNLPDYAIS